MLLKRKNSQKDISEELAIGRAESFLTRHEISSLPIDPVDIAESILDVPVQVNTNKDAGVSGMLLRLGNQFGIIYATHISNPGFQRFSVAHEIGHLMLPGHCDQLLSDSSVHESHAGFASYASFEIEADYYASGLLMPSELVNPILKSSEEGFESILAIRDACETSLSASARRYMKLTDNVAAIVFSQGPKSLYGSFSDPFKKLKGLTWKLKDVPLPEDSLTKEFNRDMDNVYSAEKAESVSNIQDWFGGDVDIQLTEQVIGLGRYGQTLTVLYAEEDLEDDECELPGMDDIRFR